MQEVSWIQISLRIPLTYKLDVIAGKISIPDKAAMQESFDVERELEAKLTSDEDMIRFQVTFPVRSRSNFLRQTT